jgi:hypothetical protein
MARRSATECAAVLDIFSRRSHPATETLQEARALLVRVVSMLVRMVHGLPDDRAATGKPAGSRF